MYIASRLCGIHQLVWCTLLYLFLFCRSGKGRIIFSLQSIFFFCQSSLAYFYLQRPLVGLARWQLRRGEIVQTQFHVRHVFRNSQDVFGVWSRAHVYQCRNKVCEPSTLLPALAHIGTGVGQCTNPYTDCCVTFSPQGCPACLANNNCGWCSNQGCRQGNNTGPNGGTGPCTGSWAYGSGCPGGFRTSPNLAFLTFAKRGRRRRL